MQLSKTHLVHNDHPCTLLQNNPQQHQQTEQNYANVMQGYTIYPLRCNGESVIIMPVTATKELPKAYWGLKHYLHLKVYSGSHRGLKHYHIFI